MILFSWILRVIKILFSNLYMRANFIHEVYMPHICFIYAICPHIYFFRMGNYSRNLIIENTLNF